MKTKLVLLALAIMAAVNTGLSQPITFTKITTGAIVADVGSYTRSAWGDFNNDGFLDLYVSNYGNRTNVFYRNNGNGTFTKITQGDPVQDADYHTGTVWGDYDNDGNLDLLASAGVGAPAARRNMLYHNNGDGTFSRVSGGSVTNQLGFFNACAWADYDNDEAVTRCAKPRVRDSSVYASERQPLYFLFYSFCGPSCLVCFQWFVVCVRIGGFVFVRFAISLLAVVAFNAEELAVSFENYELGCGKNDFRR